MNNIKKNNTIFQNPPHRMIIKIVLPVLVIIIAIITASYIQKTGPRPVKNPPEKKIPMVQAKAVYSSTKQVIIYAMGTVIPAKKLILTPRVSGEIVETHPDFLPGGYIAAKEKIIKIDPKDYELIITQKKSMVATASHLLKIELAAYNIAKQEWKLFTNNNQANITDSELALRIPHLNSAQSAMAAARAELNMAKLNLLRTEITAPFNVVVQSKNIEIGSQVSPGKQLAELTGTDEYWIQATVPVDRLKWIKIPDKKNKSASIAWILYRNKKYRRTGSVIRLLSSLENKGHMAQILISIKDPLNIKNPDCLLPAMLTGEYIHVEIKGLKLTNVFQIPRIALHSNNKIWVAENGKLSIRSINTIWRNKNTVILKSGLREGEMLIISNLAAPINNMPIRIAESVIQKPGKKNEK